ncbi:MAG TPA: hypothetical protein VK034_00740 [Enhygromyxa sp.]|nr:hypothetical protein [Enhygromyxa sp.]
MAGDRDLVRPRAALVFSAISIVAAIVVPLAERWAGIVALVLGVVLALVELALAGSHEPRSANRRPPLALGLLMLVHVGFWLAFGRLSQLLFTIAAEAGLEASRISLELLLVVPVVVLAPLLSGVWGLLERFGLEPSTAAKLSLGLVLLAGSWFCLGLGLEWALVPGLGLSLACVSLLAVAALCLGPASLTAVAELGLPEHRRAWLGVWALGYLLARTSVGWTGPAKVGALVESCALVGLGCVLAGVGLAFAWRPVAELMRDAANRQVDARQAGLSLAPNLNEAAS